MDIDKLAEAIMQRIEDDRAIHKSSIAEEIKKAMMPALVPTGLVLRDPCVLLRHPLLSDGTAVWEGVTEETIILDGESTRVIYRNQTGDHAL